MAEKCPGQDFQGKLPKLKYKKCRRCKNKVELWPPSYTAECDRCGCEVRAEGFPSCADWCKLAEKCLGPKKYKEFKKSKETKTMENHCCSHHNCIEELRADHEKILAELDKLEADPAGFAKEFLEFTESFAEPHHHKEEQVLFPALEQKGIPNEGGPIGVMLMEHEVKRGHVKELRNAAENNEIDKIKEHASAIITLLRDHISKENDILYPMAEQVLTPDELAGMAHKCEEISKGV